MVEIRFSQRVFNVDGLQVRCLEAGAGSPILRISERHGRRLIRLDSLLARTYRQITVDMRDENASARSPRDLASTMISLKRLLGLERYSLIAESFAAAVALWQALEDGENIDALVLLAPRAIVPRSGQPAGDGAIAIAPDNDLELHLPQINVPALVVFGTEDLVIASEMGRVYRTSMPNCNLAFMYDAGHTIALDRPEATAELVGDFLERRELFVVARDSSVVNP
jgi:pimeloyl-ACP methyl ester carboxylesterase